MRTFNAITFVQNFEFIVKRTLMLALTTRWSRFEQFILWDLDRCAFYA